MPHSCTPPLLVTIKGGGGLPLAGSDPSGLSGFSLKRERSRTTKHSSQPTPLLAETWELPSLSHLACTSYYKHSGCKIIQCPRTPPLLDVRPRGRNQDKPCVTMLPLASSSGTRKHTAFTGWDPGPRVGTPTDGESDPKDFLLKYEAAIEASGGGVACKVKAFVLSLKGLAQHWYSNLLGGHIHT